VGSALSPSRAQHTHTDRTRSQYGEQCSLSLSLFTRLRRASGAAELHKAGRIHTCTAQTQHIPATPRKRGKAHAHGATHGGQHCYMNMNISFSSANSSRHGDVQQRASWYIVAQREPSPHTSACDRRTMLRRTEMNVMDRCCPHRPPLQPAVLVFSLIVSNAAHRPPPRQGFHKP